MSFEQNTNQSYLKDQNHNFEEQKIKQFDFNSNSFSLSDPEVFEKECWKVKQDYTYFLGKKEQLQTRFDQITQTVGLAKGRIGRKPARENFLSNLQANAHAQTVERYSKLLTALVQDILPQEINIGLDMYTDRGLPALDIFATKGQDNTRLDIMEDCGGSLTNIVCLGLRIIATTNSGLRKFILLDEPDCWIEPENVKAFYSVLKEVTERMKFQVIVISHQSSALFENGTNVIEISGLPQDGLTVQNRGDGLKWENDQQIGFRSVEFTNFASYAKTLLMLGPGLNVVLGKNDIGKSRITRAFRSNMYGGSESSDGEIRHGEKSACVVYCMENNTKLTWTKVLKKSPVWKLTDANNNIVVHLGQKCEESGKQVPDWISQTCKIAKVGGLDIQLAHQKQPVFLLNDPPSKRAQVLSVGRESNRIQTMIAAHKENCARDTTSIKEGENEIKQVINDIDQLKNLAILDVLIADNFLILKEIKNTHNYFNQNYRNFKSLSEKLTLIENGSKQLNVFDQLVAPFDIDKKIGLNLQTKLQFEKLVLLYQTIGKYQKDITVLNLLNDSVPQLTNTQRISETGVRLKRLKNQLVSNENQLQTLDMLTDLPILIEIDFKQQIFNKIVNLKDLVLIAKSQLETIKNLPVDVPKISFQTDKVYSYQQIVKLKDDLEKAQKLVNQTNERTNQKGLELADLVSSIGNICPLCGSNVNHKHFMGEN